MWMYTYKTFLCNCSYLFPESLVWITRMSRFDWLMPGLEQSFKTNFGHSNDPRSPSATVQSFLLLGIDVSFAVLEWGQEDTTKGIQLLVCTWRHGSHDGVQEQKHLYPLGAKVHFHVACSRLRDSGEKAFSKKKCEKRATAPFPKSRASYFRFARFNTSALYYLRAWHRLIFM